MNIFRIAVPRALFLSLALPLVIALAGCETGSVDSTTAVLSDNSGTIYNFAGLYMHPSTSSTNVLPLVFPNQEPGNRPTGELITSLRLLQYGSALEAYDSAGMTWAGSISAIQNGTATFSLRGRTTAGMSTEIAGTLVYADQRSTMDATWIEPAFYGSLYAQATVAPSATNNPSSSLSLAASTYNVSSNETVTLTASGGTSSYSWPSSVAYGTFSYSGSIASYTRTAGTADNSVTISVTSGSETDSVTLEFD